MHLDTAAAAVNTSTRRRGGFLLMLVLLSGAPAMAMMFTVLAPVLPSLMQHFAGLGDGALVAQLVMTIPSIGIVLGGPLNGWLVERLGASSVLRWSLFTFGLAGAAGWLIESLPLFLGTRLAVGLAASGIATAALALVGDYFHAEYRSRVLSYQTAAGSATGFFSLLAAGALAETWGWRLPFALYLLAWPVMFCAWAALQPRGAQLQPVVAEPASEKSRLADLRPLWHLYLLIILVFVAAFMGAVQLSFLLAAEGITSPAVQSWVLATGSVGNVLGALSYGWLQPYLRGRRMFALAMVLMGAGQILMGSTEGVLLKLVGSGLSAAGAGAVGPYIASVLLERAAPAVRGRAAGLLFSATFIGDFLNPLVVAPLRTTFGIHGAFVAIGCACVAGALAALLMRSEGPQER